MPRKEKEYASNSVNDASKTNFKSKKSTNKQRSCFIARIVTLTIGDSEVQGVKLQLKLIKKSFDVKNYLNQQVIKRHQYLRKGNHGSDRNTEREQKSVFLQNFHHHLPKVHCRHCLLHKDKTRSWKVTNKQL